MTIAFTIWLVWSFIGFYVFYSNLLAGNDKSSLGWLENVAVSIVLFNILVVFAIIMIIRGIGYVFNKLFTVELNK